MSWGALFEATPPIPMHALVAMAAFLIGLLQFALPKGTLPHRVMGYIWAIAMLVVAVSGFFIQEIRLWGPFSPIHLLSIFTIYAVISSVLDARAGRMRGHRIGMIATFIGALVIAGAATLLPGRIMHQVIVGGF